MRSAPVLAVLRADDPGTLIPIVADLAAVGIVHVELAWSAAPGWGAGCRLLRGRFPELQLGAASIVASGALEQVLEAGLTYAVSPILDRGLLQTAVRLGLVLVPGVMSPSEVHQARCWGASIVKLFPAQTLGSRYWASLRAPLGGLPFCIAAGGLGPGDVAPWLAAGVDAVALGQSLFVGAGLLDPRLAALFRSAAA
ncbi:MAG: bifunctional 4-hydroxy-2-oxoglutarate aldolase/2-dehydro-3-deoxy-phosphogluconate aldolase [Cyanobacteriota bacterium]